MNPPEQSTHETTQETTLPGMSVGSVQPRPSSRIIRRKAILSNEDNKSSAPAVAPAPGAPSSLTYTVQQQQGGPGANQRRNRQTIKLVAAVVLANNFLIAGAVIWFVYSTFGDIQARLQGPVPVPHPNAVSTAAAHTLNAGSSEKEAALETKFTQEISDLHKQLAESKEQSDGYQKQHEATEQKLDQLTRRMAGLAGQVQDHGTAPAHDAAATMTSEGQNTLELPPTQAELVLLKERNRLTAFADEAIATGARDPYEQLWKAITDPRLSALVYAARAEILRVQECYLNGQRAKYYGIQQYQIPIADLLPDAGSLTPAQLSDDQLIQILENSKAPWQARVKAAWYLGRHRSTKVGDALVKAVKEDPMLDVEAEATFSFEQVTGYRSKLFEPENLEAWWKSYKAAPPSNSPAKPGENRDVDKKTPEGKSAKSGKELKPAPPEKKAAPLSEDKDSDRTAKEKPAKKEKRPVIPLREPDDKP